MDEGYSHLLDVPCEVWVEFMSHLSTAQDLVSLTSTCKQAQLWTSAHDNACWRKIFMSKWPIFFKSMKEQEQRLGAKEWKEEMRAVLEGKRSFPVQVYNRESHPGFTMSCYDGMATYRKEDGMVEIKYLAPLDRTEVVPLTNVRMIPADLRYTQEEEKEDNSMIIEDDRDDTTSDENKTTTASFPMDFAHSPFQKFTRTADQLECKNLKPGDAVEIQWKSLDEHPFGWWYGEVESIEGKKAKIVFKQFHKEEVFYSVSFELPGMKSIQQASGSGTYGGIRGPLSPQEKAEWQRFRELNQ